MRKSKIVKEVLVRKGEDSKCNIRRCYCLECRWNCGVYRERYILEIQRRNEGDSDSVKWNGVNRRIKWEVGDFFKIISIVGIEVEN